MIRDSRRHGNAVLATVADDSELSSIRLPNRLGT